MLVYILYKYIILRERNMPVHYTPRNFSRMKIVNFLFKDTTHVFFALLLENKLTF